MPKYNLRHPVTKRFISKADYDNLPEKTKQEGKLENKPYHGKPKTSDIITIGNRTIYRHPETKRFIKKSEYDEIQSTHARSFRERLAYGEPMDGVTVQGKGNRYSIFVKAVSSGGFTTYHELIQGSVKLDSEGERKVMEKARERYDHHGRIKIIPLHTIDRADGTVIRGDDLRGSI